ncbi:MAG TPA: ATP-binding protein [Solirubrobacteraceae bacterium]
MDFLNRTDDLAALDDLWAAQEAHFFVVWGRRRVGKTELLSKFAEGKRAFYFEATDTTELAQLRSFSEELAAVGANELLAAQPVSNWAGALAAMTQYASAAERTLIILDEFQYLAAQQRELGTLLNNWWRTTGRDLPLVFIIAGSEVSFFREEVLGGQMYGRRSGQLPLVPFDYSAAALFVPGYSDEDKVRTYAVCGGMPYYLDRFVDTRPLAENILRNVLHRDGFLHEEADLLLRQELPDPRRYFSVLDAIARGATRNSEIAQRTGLDSAQTYQTLDMLERLELVEQLRPATASPTSKKTSYAIRDGFLNFYFRFVEPYKSRMRTRADAERHLEHTVLPHLDAFVSKPAWERICQDYIKRQEPEARAVGAWWGKVQVAPKRTEEREIDAVAIDPDGKVIATGSCKWTNSSLDYGEEILLNQIEPHIPGAEDVARHYFFSRSGFTEQLHKLAASDPGRYLLVTPEVIYQG